MVAQDVVVADVHEGDKQCDFLGKAFEKFLAGTSCGRSTDTFMDKEFQNSNEELPEEFHPCPCLNCVENVPNDVICETVTVVPSMQGRKSGEILVSRTRGSHKVMDIYKVQFHQAHLISEFVMAKPC